MDLLSGVPKCLWNLKGGSECVHPHMCGFDGMFAFRTPQCG